MAEKNDKKPSDSGMKDKTKKLFWRWVEIIHPFGVEFYKKDEQSKDLEVKK